MRPILEVAAAFALVPLVAAANAPLIHNNPFGVTFSATIGQHDATSVSGAVKIAAAPDGEGVNVQISLFNLPSSGRISYGLHTNSAPENGDCSTTGGFLNPYNGATGLQCMRHPATCQVGDLSDRHGSTTVLRGGSGTGYFAASYINKFLSLRPEDPAYVGGRSLVVMSDTGAYLACANFINAMESQPSPTNAKEQASSMAASSLPAATTTKAKPYPYPLRSGIPNGPAYKAAAGLTNLEKYPIVIVGIVLLALAIM